MFNYLFGYQCYLCQKETNTKHNLCETCQTKLNFIPLKNGINTHSFYFNELHILFEYTKELKQIIHLYKFENKRKLSIFLSEQIKQRFSDDFFNSYDYIVPVPLHPKKFKKRGFNQTEKVIRSLVSEEKIFKAIKKVKTTKQQSLTHSREERLANTKNIFEIDSLKIPDVFGKRILLFDDVFTTGATLNAMAKPFFYSKATCIDVLTLGVS